MRVLILDTYYPAFLRTFFMRNQQIVGQPYAVLWRALQDQCFGTADFYSTNLVALGHEAHEVVINCDEIQFQWACEYAPHLAQVYPFALATHVGRVQSLWRIAVMQAQIEQYRPDVLYVQDLLTTPASLLRWARRRVRLIAGQTAYPLPGRLDLRPYDLLLTSFPHYVARFLEQGLASEYLRIAFEPRVLNRLPHDCPSFDTIFVGSYSTAHRQGVQMLEQVTERTPVEFWGYGIEQLPTSSPIRRHYHGEAWGLDMYTILAGTRVALNRHINVAAEFANNMRLYEATGVGACLVTDRKTNLGELFDIDREVVAYGGAEECAEQVRYLLDHESERRCIAAAGQQRTLREHTYAHRMQELAPMLERYMRQPISANRRTFTIRNLRKTFGRLRNQAAPVSYGHRQINVEEIDVLSQGWQSDSIPKRQRQLVTEQLRRMYHGKNLPVFRVAAEAIQATRVKNPLIIELGCASAYYSEALTYLLKQPIRYIGLDYSVALLQQARQYYEQIPLAGADATALPLADKCCDIVFSSALLMHVPDYQKAISEAARLAGSWCIFHRTPVIHKAATTALAKYAYGVQVVELVFNEGEFIKLLGESGLEVERTLLVESYELPEVFEQVELKTFVCRKRLM